MYSNQQQSTVVATGASFVQQQQIVMTQQFNVNTTAIKRLSIAQIVIGVVCLVLGVLLVTPMGEGFFFRIIGGGIWGGVIFIIAGIIGVLLAREPISSCFLGTIMAFNIVATVVAFSDGIVSVIGIWARDSCVYVYRYYNDFDQYHYSSSYVCAEVYGGLALFGTLAALMASEFFIALVAAIYCCSGCCSSRIGGVVNQQPQSNYIMTSNVSSQYGQYPVSTVPQVNPSFPSNGQPAYTSANMAAYRTPDVRYTDSTDTEKLVDETNENPPAYAPEYSPQY